VAVDLLARGYEVFHAFSPSCSCDLAILKDRSLLRVEVKTGYRWKGKVHHAKPRDGCFDIIAVVIEGEPVIYEPSTF